MRHSRLAGWALRVVIGLALGLVLRAFIAADLFASHPYRPDEFNNHLHLKSMTDFITEDYCVDVTQSSLAQAHAAVLSTVAGAVAIAGGVLMAGLALRRPERRP